MRAQGRNESRGRVCVRPGIDRERQKMNEWQQTERLEIKVQSSLWQWKTMRKNQETKIIHLTARREAKPELPNSCSNNISSLTEIGIRVCHCSYFYWKKSSYIHLEKGCLKVKVLNRYWEPLLNYNLHFKYLLLHNISFRRKEDLHLNQFDLQFESLIWSFSSKLINLGIYSFTIKCV